MTTTMPDAAPQRPVDSFSDQPATEQREEQNPTSDSPTSQEGHGTFRPEMDAEEVFERIGRLSREIEIALDAKGPPGSPWVRVSGAFAMSVPVLLEGSAETDILAALDKGIEDLIALRDAMTADPELEPTGDELDASRPEGGAPVAPEHLHEDDEEEPDRERTWRETNERKQTSDRLQAGDQNDDDEDSHDREAVNEDGDDLDAGEEDRADFEPSLGWTLDGQKGEGDLIDGEQGVGPLVALMDARRVHWKAGGKYDDPVGDMQRRLRRGSLREQPDFVLEGGKLIPIGRDTVA